MSVRQILRMVGRRFVRIFLCVSAVLLIILLSAQFIMGIGGFTNLIAVALLLFYLLWVRNTYFFAFVSNFLSKYKAGRIFKKIISISATVFLIYGLIVSSAMIISEHLSPKKDSTLIVLGCMVRDSEPSPMLWKRIDAAYEYLEENKGSCAVLSGGLGEGDTLSEAQAMYNALVDYGIDKSRLFLEENSYNTNENIKNSIEIIEKNGLSTNIAIATDGFHQLRAQIISRKAGLTSIGAARAKTDMHLIPAYWFREWFAIPVEIIDLSTNTERGG